MKTLRTTKVLYFNPFIPQKNKRYSYLTPDAQQLSPFVANPKDISLHEEHTTPIETLQKQIEVMHIRGRS